jgi:parallel beta-helix repeat protein
MKPRTVVLAVSALSLVGATGLLIAGPLNPPAGSVTSTYKTLGEVEPRIAISANNTPGDADSVFRITQPGSYYLTGNITGVVGKHGIEIVSSEVTLDLNGFDLAGIAGMGNFDGVSATGASLTGIAVLNGSIRNWGSDGINLGSQNVSASRVQGVRASGNFGYGIYAGLNSTISGCSAVGGQAGISARDGSTISDCSAKGASSFGIYGSSGCTLSHCSAYLNTGIGIFAGNGGILANCTAFNNTGIGIASNPGCTLTGCSAYFNTGDGINVDTGSTVIDCTVRQNTLDGIRCTTACTIRGNTCSANGIGDGAGIHATGDDNRIEGNTCIGADRGIHVAFAGNIIVRNACSGNTIDWAIVANNVLGPILDRRAPGSAGVNGFSAPSSLGSTDSNANYSY